MKKQETLKEMVRRIIKEETTNMLTMNVGGVRYQVSRNGAVKRLGSDEMDFGSNFKLIGATTNYGFGNRRFTKSDVDITLEDIFNNPDSLVGNFPLAIMDGKIEMYLGNRNAGNQESNYKVLWVK